MSEKIRDHFSRVGREVVKLYDMNIVKKIWEEKIDELKIEKNQPYPVIPQPKKIKLEDLLDREKKDRILYVMPGTFGDLFLSTAVFDGIKKKYPDKDIYVATDPRFKEVLDGNSQVYKILDFDPIFTQTRITNQLFEITYTPFLETQHSDNWTKNGHGKHLAQVYADHCQVELGKQFIQIYEFQDAPKEDYVAIHVKTGQEPKNFQDWQKVVDRIAIKVVQVGAKDDPLLKNVIDMRGKKLQETAGIIKKARLFLGGDSICAHIAGYTKTSSILTYASTFPSLTKPLGLTEDVKYLIIEPSDRYGCDRACHSASCFRGKRSCMDNIPTKSVIDAVEAAGIQLKDAPKPTISGYLYTRNPNKYYPWRQCIKSLLGFCDEVIVVDCFSTDGTADELNKWKKEEPKLKVYKRRWRDEEPTMDGIMKAYSRALCTKEFCFSVDADEIVHEKDYEAILKMTQDMPTQVDMYIMPVIDLYGSTTTVRVDRGLYKWRLSRNIPSITHGVPKQLRQYDKNGKLFCDKNLCDSCFPIDTKTGEMIGKQATFVNQELMDAANDDVPKFKELMKKYFQELPSIWHYSWHNLERRIKLDLEVWDKMWANLNQTELPSETRFFPGIPRDQITDEMIKAKAEEMKDKKLDGTPMDLIKIDWFNQPAVMEGYF